jgi:hypothetical protein
LHFCDSPYEIVVVTNDDTLWESRVKTNTCFEMYATYTLDPSCSPRPARIEGRIQYVVKVSGPVTPATGAVETVVGGPRQPSTTITCSASPRWSRRCAKVHNFT